MRSTNWNDNMPFNYRYLSISQTVHCHFRMGRVMNWKILKNRGTFFSGTPSKLRRAMSTLSCPSVCPSAWKKLGSPLYWFLWTIIFEVFLFSKICRKYPNFTKIRGGKNGYITWKGHAVAHLVEALRYKSEGREFDSRKYYWTFFIYIILPATLWPWGWLSFWQKWVRGIFPGGKGGRCIGLTILPPSCTDCLEIWEPQTPGTLRAWPGT